MGADYPINPWEKKDISVTKTIGGCIGEIQGNPKEKLSAWKSEDL
jgi:hypothetical protein